MTLLADLLSTVFERRPRLRRPDDGRALAELTSDLHGAAGEVSGRTTAEIILGRFAGMTDDEKHAFFRHLACDLVIDPAAVRDALQSFEAAQTRGSYRAFLAAAEPPRQELIRRLNQVPGGTETLVRMRADLLRLGKDDPDLQAISWDSPAHVLEKIIAYEAVHAIDSWDDLRRRLKPADRRCFAFFHPAMPDEPLIFVEVALTQGVPESIQTLLAEDRAPLEAEEADTAVFYSISNCQEGLAGVSFGNSLIKQVVADLAGALPLLRTFVTLSPIPGLAKWMQSEGHADQKDDPEQMRQLAALYLLKAKRPGGLPLDPVARFHLGNGAQIHKVHAGADTSPKGQAEAYGAMVNYLYDLDRVSQNHEGFATSHKIAATSELRSLSAAAERNFA
jgi:malonyl-CoA decarboxylase